MRVSPMMMKKVDGINKIRAKKSNDLIFYLIFLIIKISYLSLNFILMKIVEFKL